MGRLSSKSLLNHNLVYVSRPKYSYLPISGEFPFSDCLALVIPIRNIVDHDYETGNWELRIKTTIKSSCALYTSTPPHTTPSPPLPLKEFDFLSARMQGGTY